MANVLDAHHGHDERRAGDTEHGPPEQARLIRRRDRGSHALPGTC
jgi:hypothetical protein